MIKELETKRDEAVKLVNVIGNVGATGNYQNIANAHKKTADNWRNIALCLMIVIACFLVYNIWDIREKNYDSHKAIIRIISAFAFIYPATYAQRESSKHRKLENFNRRTELELASINPFIEILDTNKKQEIKAKLTEKFFGNNSNIEIDNSKADEVSIGGLDKIAKIFMNILDKK